MTWLPTAAAILALIWIAGTLIELIFRLLDWHEERGQHFPNHDAITAAARRTLMAWAWPITATRITITIIRNLIDDAKH